MSTRLVIVAFACALVLAGAGVAVAVSAQDGGGGPATQAGTVDITADAAVDIAPASTANGDAYALERDGELALEFSRLNEDARTRADRVFTITAQGVDPINVSARNLTATGLELYLADDPGQSMRDPVALEPGDSVDIGVAIDTTGSYGSGTIRINATAPDGQAGGGPAGPGPGPGDGGDDDSDISVVGASVSPADLAPGDDATVTATLRNEGTAAGTYTAALEIDGVIVDRQTVEVPAGGEVTVSFERTFQQAGTFEVAVDGVAAGSVTVAAPPDEPDAGGFAVTDASLSPSTIAPGETTTISATVENRGNESGFFFAELAVGGAVVEDQAVEVPANGTAEVTFERQFQRQGSYDLAVGGVEAGTLRVESDTASSMRRYGGLFAWLFGAASVPAMGAGFVAVRRRRRRRRFD